MSDNGQINIATNDAALALLQSKIQARLAADPMFSNVPVLHEQIKDIESELERALGPVGGVSPTGTSAAGILAIVLTPTFRVKSPNVPGPWFDDVDITIRVVENVTINQTTGTKKPALQIVKAAARLLHQYYEPGIFAPLVVEQGVLVVDPENLVYDLKLKASLRDVTAGGVIV